MKTMTVRNIPDEVAVGEAPRNVVLEDGGRIAEVRCRGGFLEWIAVSALEHGFELLTHDGHFNRIPMLNVVEG